jgi:hypothetical protein
MQYFSDSKISDMEQRWQVKELFGGLDGVFYSFLASRER